eukprot:COSAG02_NODE_31215_length_537_cov_0.940639_1_plen_107_part_00
MGERFTDAHMRGLSVASDFKQGSNKLRKKMWWKNAKLNACILVTIIGETVFPAHSLVLHVERDASSDSLRNLALVRQTDRTRVLMCVYAVMRGHAQHFVRAQHASG